jgi:hypothetical protein
VAVASIAGKSAFAGVFRPKDGWTTQSFSDTPLVGRPALVSSGGQVHALVRVFDGVNQDVLWKSIWSDSWGALVKVGPGYASQDDASFSASGVVGWATYRRGGKHQAISFNGGIFGAETTLGTDAPQAFGNSPASVLVGASESWGVYAGSDEGLYVVRNPGAGWSKSAGVAGAGSKNFITPAVVFDEKDQPTIFFVRNSDSRICTTTWANNSWSAPAPIASDALTGSAPVALRTASGLLVVWRGFSNDGLFYAYRPENGAWGAPKAIETEAGVISVPALTRGASGADAEVLYVKGGQLRHVRFSGGAAGNIAVVPGTSGLQEVGATLFAN